MRAERRAWLVIWLAFFTFCAVVVSAVKFGVDYVTTADIDLTARVDEARGFVTVQASSGAEPRLATVDRELTVGTIVEGVRGAPAGTASVRMFDGSTVEVQPGGRVELQRMDIGRYISRQTVVLGQDQGAVQYRAANEMTVNLPNGSVVLSPGDFTVWISSTDGRTRVLAYGGKARLLAERGEITVTAGSRGELTADGRLTGPEPRAQNLLANSDFSRRSESWDPIDDVQGRDTPGVRNFLIGTDSLGFPTLQIFRESLTLSHGETGLRQRLNMDISGFRHLWVRALVRVDRASLSGGGQFGSEYPLMFRSQYEGIVANSTPNWVHGFFYDNPDGLPVPYGEQVTQGQWREYTVDLLAQDEGSQPYRLIDFDVLAQGHSFDSRVANLRLIGE
jgi:hypothetical protein